ncbi:hypothetical protein ACFV4M_05935 [Kitasatospora indigofera]|uniref:hypothetical protein n=1 Tax=Kitasatospora indigofera TaxID=67307 RepID=UPI0036684CBD
MTCAECRAAMSARLDGEDAGGPGGAVGAVGTNGHEHSCADCAGWLATARRLRDFSARAPGPSAEWSEGLLGRLGLGQAEDRGSAEDLDRGEDRA